ncbi:isopentenyl-diphosphate Delta-isomerase [Microbacterium sp. ZW T5_45]|uniref:isopentenyl-diphosphate Delta-isomerase n=1 Tax=Microbacterium sp. ZW T5_45 TaxID=3378080 RepID=UPI003852B993
MDEVTLLDDAAVPIGTLPKHEVHTTDTPLHLAFSCHLLDADGRILLTRRALSKQTWPGVWTNSFCGHPRPGEAMLDAVHRRAADELGVRVSQVRTVLPDYRYRAVDASGIVENEICPVHLAVLEGPMDPRPEEVSEWAWASPDDIVQAVQSTPFVFSPWMREQIGLLRSLGAI